MLNKKIPFLRIGLPLYAGIVTGLYYHPDKVIIASSLLVIFIGFLISLRYNKTTENRVFGFILSFALFICGLILYTHQKDSLSVLNNTEKTFSCTVSDYPEEKDNSVRMTVKLRTMSENNRNVSVKGSVLLYNKKDISSKDFLPGDILVIRCTPVRIVNRGNPYEFDYRFFMENQGIRYYAFTDSKDILRHTAPGHRGLVFRALMTRQRVIDMFRDRGIEGDRLALVAAITLGQKKMLDPEQKQAFMKAGVMHIMAVSGLHAIILSLFVMNILFFMKRRLNTLRIIITITILWGFAFVTGLTPSVLRATMMFSFLQAGKLMNRPANGINSVLASAFFLAVIKPSVIFDAGFLLSYSAVIYIICFYQDFYLLLNIKNWLADKIWQSAAVTIIAQAGTLPLTITLFNRFPTYFILANIIIVPVSNLLIITGCLIPVFYHIPFISYPLASILNLLTGLTEKLTTTTASLPFSTLENIGLSIPECILLTVSIFFLLKFLLNRKEIKFSYPLLILLFFAISGTIRDIATRTTDELIVYNTPGITTIGIRTGKSLRIYSDTTAIRPEVKRHAAVLDLKIRPVLIPKDIYAIDAGKSKILIAKKLSVSAVFKPDITIITGDIERKLSDKPAGITIFLNSGFGKAAGAGFSVTDSVHSIRREGAFVKRL